MSQKQRAIMIAGAIGAAIGVLGGLIYYNNNVRVDREGAENLAPPSGGDMVKFGVALLGALRLIAE